MANYEIDTVVKKDISRTYTVEADCEGKANELLWTYVSTPDNLKHTLINADKVKLIHKKKVQV